jgi:hypothetical protein
MDDDSPEDLLEQVKDLLADCLQTVPERETARARYQHDFDEELGEYWYGLAARPRATQTPASIVRLPTFEQWRALHRLKGPGR